MRYLNFKTAISEEDKVKLEGDKKNREKFKKEIEDLTKDLNKPLTKLDDPADSNKTDREKEKINARAINEYHAFVIQEFNKLSRESELISKKPESESKKIEQKQNNEKTLTLIKNLEKEEKLKTFLDRDENKVKKTALEGALYDLSPACYPQTKIIGSNARSSRKTPIIDGKPSKIQTGYQLVKSETLAKLSKGQNPEFTKNLTKTLKLDASDISNFLTQEENADFSDAEIAKKHLEKAFILAKLKINLDSYSEDEQESGNCFACFRGGKKLSPQSNLSSLIEKKLKAEIEGFSQSKTESHSQKQSYLDDFNKKYLDFINAKFNEIAQKQDSNEILKFESTIENCETTFNYLNGGSSLIKRKALEIIFDEATNQEFKKTLGNNIIFNHEDIDDFLNRKTDTITLNNEKISEKEKLLQLLIDRTNSDSSLFALITSPEMTNEIFKRNLQPRLGETIEIQVNNIISTVDDYRSPIEISAGPILASFEFAPVAANTPSAGISRPAQPRHLQEITRDTIPTDDDASQKHIPMPTKGERRSTGLPGNQPTQPAPDNLKPPVKLERPKQSLEEDAPSEPASGRYSLQIR